MQIAEFNVPFNIVIHHPNTIEMEKIHSEVGRLLKKMLKLKGL